MKSAEQEDVDESSSGLATICFGFFLQEFNVNLHADDVLSSKGLGVDALDALEQYLHEMIGFKFSVPLSDATASVSFAQIVARCDAAMRKKNVDIEKSVSDLLEPDPAAAVPAQAPSAPRAVSASDASSNLTPTTKRKNAIEKGIGACDLYLKKSFTSFPTAKFAGMTLRNRNPAAQSQRAKAAVQRPTARANVVTASPASTKPAVAVPSKDEWESLKFDDDPKQ